MDTQISENQKAWDIVAHEFFDASALPVWGPFGIGDDLNLISEIKGKTFFEIACGSGRSIKYLLDNRATKVYGLDFSGVQLEEAKRFNTESVNKGTAIFIHGKMEDKLDIEPVDTVFSVYGVGWTQDPVVPPDFLNFEDSRQTKFELQVKTAAKKISIEQPK